jgi:hypothetical protein
MESLSEITECKKKWRFVRFFLFIDDLIWYNRKQQEGIIT